MLLVCQWHINIEVENIDTQYMIKYQVRGFVTRSFIQRNLVNSNIDINVWEYYLLKIVICIVMSAINGWWKQICYMMHKLNFLARDISNKE